MIRLAVDNTPKSVTDTAIVIPARLASTRFPQKMLKEVTPGVPLIQHVYNQVCEQWHKEDVYVATDSLQIAALFGDKAVMTSEFCKNGTERIAEAAFKQKLKNYEYFVNVQGDMVDVPADAIDKILMKVKYGADVATICKEMDEKDQQNPSVVKCINNGKRAHWFGRAAIPYGDWHLGIYGYTRKALHMYPALRKYAEEDIEQLEQLRWIQNGVKMSIMYTQQNAAEINTPEDLDNWQRIHQS